MDCIIIDDDKLSRRIIEKYIEKIGFLNLLASFENAVDALDNFNKETDVDLIFLDVEMPEMTGIEFLNSLNNPPQVIIISTNEKYALEAFEYNVTDYLLKPVSYSRFNKASNKAFEKFQKNRVLIEGEGEIFVKRGTSLIRIRFEEILWVEALENYVVIYTPDDKFMIHFTMKSIEKQLPIYKFKRVHRSYIINVDYLKQIEDNTVLLEFNGDTKSLPIGKSYKDNLLGDIRTILK